MVSKFGNIGTIVSFVLLAIMCQIVDYSFMIPGKPISDIKAIQIATVLINHYVTDEQGDPAAFKGTGWVFKSDKKLNVSFVMTAAHVVDHDQDGEVEVEYWSGEGGWETVTAVVILKRIGRIAGDVAILIIPVVIEPLPIATSNEYRINDEVLVSGVQNQAPPALLSLGYITKINNSIDKVIISGWSWRGHSGGPVIHRKTGYVIGFVSMFATYDTHHASATECSDLTVINDAITQAGLK